jgi:hypothetical protein
MFEKVGGRLNRDWKAYRALLTVSRELGDGDTQNEDVAI